LNAARLVHATSRGVMLTMLVVKNNIMVKVKYITTTTGRFHACTYSSETNHGKNKHFVKAF
jgi:hypothetical protein